MIAALSNTLKKYTNGRVILVFFALMLVFALFIVPSLAHKLEASSGGSGPIDMLFSYEPEKVYSIIASYGDESRAAYRQFAMSSDVVYPVVYSIFFGLILTWLFQRSFSSDSKLQMLNVVPLGAWLFDWLENINIVTMLSLYPETSPTVAKLASLCTSIKWGFGTVGIVLVLVGFAMAAKNRFRVQ